MRKLSAYIFFFWPFLLFAQPDQIFFKHLSTDQGLSQGLVNCLLKDQEGFIWAGTQDGLNRFDGYQFSIFRNEPGDATSLSNNYIWTLFEDTDGKIWIGTYGGGLCSFDKKTERFQTFLTGNSPKQNSIRAIEQSPDGFIFLGTDQGLFKFDPTEEVFHEIPLLTKNEEPFGSIYSIKLISPEFLLIGSIGQIFHLNVISGKIRKTKMPYLVKGGIHVFESNNGNGFWMGTGHGLFQIQFFPNLDSVSFLSHHLFDAKIPSSLPSNFISDLFLDKNHILWLATNNGLSALNTTSVAANFLRFQHDAQNAKSISNDLIYSLLEIEPGEMWAGTQKGINQFSTDQSPFWNISFSKLAPENCGQSAHGMWEDPNGILWLGTDEGLTQMRNFRSGKDPNFFCFQNEYLPEIQHDFIISISPGSNQTFWAALRRGGFARFFYDNGELLWEAFQIPFEPNPNIGSNDVFEDEKGDVWIATSGLGLYKLDTLTREFEIFRSSPEDSTSLSGNYIFHLQQAQDKTLWISTADGGLCKMDKSSKEFDCYISDPKQPNSLSNDMVLSVFEDSKKRIWVCTANGLNLYDGQGQFQRFFEKDGLPNNVIYGMLEDDSGSLWVSTNNGISKIDFKDGVLHTQNFDTSNGLSSNEFNQHAFYKTQNGRLCFGGVGGLTIFNPKDIKPYKHLPEVVLTDFQLFNSSVPIQVAENKKQFSIQNSINHLSKITLPHHQNFIAFEFAGLSHRHIEKNTYAYQMEGLDEDWVNCGTRRYAGYPNLAPGIYTFKVKAANYDGIWNETPKTIQIEMLSPPWKTWWAYLLYLLALGAAIYGVIWFRVSSIRKIEQAKLKEREQFRRRSARDFHDEAGNKITKISLMTEMAKRQSSENQSLNSLLIQIEENIQELRTGMRDFIWVLDPANDNLYETLSRLKAFANSIFEYSDTHFSATGISEIHKKITLNSTQRRHLLLIFKEAINNCLKYAKASEAQLEVYIDEQKQRIRLKDNGVGFNPEEKTEGNGLKNMNARAEKLGANLKISSEISGGTEICLEMEITQMGN